MRLIADLHIHSKYSRATSRDMNLPNLAHWARLKGIDVLGTGDFTHPAHFSDIEALLEEDESGLLRLKGSDAKDPFRFMLTAEVSNIYTKAGKTRKIHNLIFAPTLDAARKISAEFGRLGNIRSDGRPIFGFSAEDLLKIVIDIDPRSMLVPAHAWTPWFSIFGSRSGFDSIEECFGALSGHIRAIETGLSSNPAMNRRVSMLDDIALISNSDAHSPGKLGREANVLDCEPTFDSITGAIKSNDNGKFLYTIEFFPEEGKYHADGHRNCGVILTPEETKRHEGICPVCKGPLTIGVLSRVFDLADRPEGKLPGRAIPSRAIVPLEEIIAETLSVSTTSVKVKREYLRLVSEGGSEFNILLDMSEENVRSLGGEKLAEAIMRVRREEVSLTPGYDGEFGKVRVFGKEMKPTGAKRVLKKLL